MLPHPRAPCSSLPRHVSPVHDKTGVFGFDLSHTQYRFERSALAEKVRTDVIKGEEGHRFSGVGSRYQQLAVRVVLVVRARPLKSCADVQTGDVVGVPRGCMPSEGGFIGGRYFAGLVASPGVTGTNRLGPDDGFGGDKTGCGKDSCADPFVGQYADQNAAADGQRCRTNVFEPAASFLLVASRTFEGFFQAQKVFTRTASGIWFGHLNR